MLGVRGSSSQSKSPQYIAQPFPQPIAVDNFPFFP